MKLKKMFWFTVLVFLGMRFFVAVPYTVPSRSMQPTVLPGDRVLTLVSYYGLRLPWQDEDLISWTRPVRGDVLVFRKPGSINDTYIKRVVAVGGDRVRIVGKELYVNDQSSIYQLANETDLDEKVRSLVVGTAYREQLPGTNSSHLILYEDLPSADEIWPKNGEEYVVPAYQYFMLGDYRDHSSDSRMFGAIKDKHVIGRAVGVVWSHPIPRRQVDDEAGGANDSEDQASRDKQSESSSIRWFRMGTRIH